MDSFEEKIRGDKKPIHSNAESVNEHSKENANPFVDNRPEATAQRKLQTGVNNSPQVKNAHRLHAVANAQAPVQRKSLKETYVDGSDGQELFPTVIPANGLTQPMQLKNGNLAQLLTIQRVGDDKPAKLHVHADLDAPGMALLKQLSSGEVGHAWISLEWNDPSSVPADIPDNHRTFLGRGGMQADPMGFWPKMFSDYDPIKDQWANLPDDERESYSSNPFNSKVPGQMVHPDNLHRPKATQSFDLTHDQAKSVINYAESKRGAEYSVFYYNCTTFAKEAAKAGGQSPPSMGKLGICYPDALYKSIVSNHKKKKGTTTTYDKAGTPTTVEGNNSAKKG